MFYESSSYCISTCDVDIIVPDWTLLKLCLCVFKIRTNIELKTSKHISSAAGLFEFCIFFVLFSCFVSNVTKALPIVLLYIRLFHLYSKCKKCTFIQTIINSASSTENIRFYQSKFEESNI